MKFIDFFSGAGGVRMGLEASGHECVGFCEFDRFARQSYKAIFNTEEGWENHDVRTVDPMELPRADLWCFGFPCQDISVAGKQKGLLEGKRSNLFFQIIRLLHGVPEENKPKWLLAENVKNLLSVGRGWDFARCICALGEAGYDIEWQLFNTKYAYNVAGVCVPGIPQNRERVYLVGRLIGDGCTRKVFPIQRADTKNPLELQEITEGMAQFHRVYKDDGVAPSLMCSITKTARIATEAKVSQIGRKADAPSSQFYQVYDKDGLAPTLRAGMGMGGNTQPMIIGDNPTGEIEPLGSYSPGGYNATMVVDSKGVAPTVRENHGQVTATVVKAVLTPDRQEKRQNGRRIKEEGEPMFTLTTQDRHGVAIEIGHEISKDGKVMQSSKVYDTKGISPTLCAGHGSTIPNVVEDMPSTDKDEAEADKDEIQV